VRGLSWRLGASLVALAIIAVSLLDVAFLFYSEATITVQRRAAQRAALNEARAAERVDAAFLRQVADDYGMILTAMGADGARLGTGAVHLPEPQAALGEPRVEGAYEHLAAPLGRGPFTWVVASRRRDEGLSRALALQGPAILGFGAAALGMTVLAWWLLRRAVVLPLRRMTYLVQSDDKDALSRFIPDARDPLAVLSHAIIAQNQRIADDRAQIAAQLTELTTKNAALAQAQTQLLRAERLAVVGQLAAGLAHEVGNPLAVLSGFVEVLSDPGLPVEQRTAALQRMGKELDRIHTTVRHLLDFSRAPASVERDGELGEVLTHVRELVAPQDRFRRVEVEWPVLERVIVVPVGPDALTQLVLNLVLNAADALAGEGKIRIGVAATAEEVRLEVADSGPGIPADVLPRIFEPFFTTKPAGSGTGLGLAVCERVVSAAGGDIRAGKSDLGGALFSVTLPARAARAR
jgi:two-component system, NtrC family, sensor kinase